MERQFQSSPKMDSPVDDDVKYVSGLSTILVATIQEAKERISQVEYIFCSQLFPNFQSKSKLVSSVYVEARRAAEDEWKRKENELFLRIEQLEREKQQTLQENQNLLLKLEKASNIKEQQENMSELRVQIKRQRLIVDELELKLQQKSAEVDEGLKLENSLLELIQSKGSEIVDKEKESKRLKENIFALLTQIGNLDREMNGLQDQLKEKTEIVAKMEERVRDHLKEIKSQALQITENEQVMRDQEKEREKLTANLRSLEETVHQLRSCQNVNLNGSEISKHLEDSERENKLLSTKVNALEEKIKELQVDLRDRTNDLSKEKDLYQTALEQIESKTAELLAAQGRVRDVLNSYKRLKSQYNYLRKKSGLSEENMFNALKSHNEPDSQNSPDLETRDSEGQEEAKSNNSLNNEKSEAPNYSSPTLPIVPESNSAVKSAKLAGSKRSATSRWRDTRSPQDQNGLDPHDDFLNTPLEIIRGNLNKVAREVACEKQIPAQKEKVDISDDETRDVSLQKNPRPELVTKGKGYKFVEPVRKKADRENLKGVECRQCKKFYDAVLCGDDVKDGDNDKQNIRCEHHEGVSRHRYRYVPPLTPEGFWNIGFESEM